MNFKKPLLSEEQIAHLEKNKNVKFDNIVYSNAELYLRGFNYINLITPFKHNYSKKDAKSKPLKIFRDDRLVHIYPNNIDFLEYLKLFEVERIQYSEIMDGLHKFEIAFKSLVTYYLVTHFKIDSTTKAIKVFENFQSQLRDLEIVGFSSSNSDIEKRKDHMYRNYENIIKDFRGTSYKPPYNNGKKVSNMYVYLDRLSLKSVINIFYSFHNSVQNKIFNDLTRLGCNLENTSIKKFKRRIFNLYPIRNAVMHCNSLEILYRYNTPGKSTLRSYKSKMDYKKTVLALKKLSQKDIFCLTSSETKI